MHQKGFKEILPKEPTCGLKGLLRSSMGPNNLSHNIILENHKIILLITDNKLIKQ